MLVQDAMSSSVRTVKSDTALQDVAAEMCLSRVNGLPVIDDDNNLIGFVAEKDILHCMFPKLEDLMDSTGVTDFLEMENQYRDVMGLKVADVMTKGVLSVRPDIPLLKAISVMVRNRFRRIPVAEDGKLVGIISIGDVHKSLFKQNITLAG